MAEKRKSDAQLARREAEFEAIFNSISDVVIFVDSRRRVRMVNSAMETVFGYTQEELQGKETRIIYANPEDFDEQGKIRYNSRAQEQPQIYRMHYHRKDGTTFPGETLGTQVRDHQGKVLGYVGIIRDITERMAAEKAATRARDLSQQLLTFSKGGQPVRKPARLSKLINESAAFALTGSNVTCNLQIADHLRPVNIDKGQISQVIQMRWFQADMPMTL